MNIAFINHKGGIGKTTLSVNTAMRYREKKKHVVVVDYDRQHNATQLLSGWSWNGQDRTWSDSSGQIEVVVEALFEDIKKCPCDILFDCPPSLGEANEFVDWLYKYGVGVDIWIVPVEGRTSIKGAETIVEKIRMTFPASRIVLVMNRCNQNELTKNDKSELTQFPNVELYNQVIPQSSIGLTMFEQKGKQPVWEYYKQRKFATQMRAFCDWIVGGCSLQQTFKNSLNQSVDNVREIYITTPTNQRKNYGEWK